MRNKKQTITINRAGKSREIDLVQPIVSRETDVMPVALPQLINQQPVAHVQEVTTGDHKNKALGFVIETSTVGFVIGVLSCIIWAIGEDVIFMFSVFWGGFCLTWVAAYCLHKFMSGHGVAIWQAWLNFRNANRLLRETFSVIKEEQEFRRERYYDE